MPAVAVGAAIWGGTALAAGATGFAAIAALGAVATGIGVVTGNKDIVKIGGLMGLVGGAGTLAVSKGLIADPFSSDIGLAAGTADPMGAPLPVENAPGAVASQAMEGVINTAVPPAAESVVDVPKIAADAVSGASMPAAENIGLAASELDPMGASLTASAPKDIGLAAGNFDPMGSPLSGGKSVLESIKDKLGPLEKFAKDNQMLSYGMMQVGGNFMSGLFDTTKEAQKRALEARAGADIAQTGLLNQQAANMSAPVPVAGSTQRPDSVFRPGAAPTYNRPVIAGGILNSVTGRPA